MKTKLMMGLISLLMVGCIHNTPPSIVPPAPPKTESAIPPLIKVDEKVKETIKENIKLEAKIKEQQQVVSEQRIAIVEALAQAEKMKEKVLANQTISEMETINLIVELKKVESRNLFLETKNTELGDINKTQTVSLNELNDRVRETMEKLIKKEKELEDVRTQYDFVSNIANTKSNEVENLKTELSKEKVKAANYFLYKKWVIIIICGFVLWTIIKNLLMIYFPAIKFRI